MDIRPALQDLAARLTSTGLRASAENGTLNPPCAWVHPGPITPLSMNSWQMGAQVTLITRPTKPLNDLDKLGEMLELALSVVDPAGEIATDATAAIGDKAFPAFSFTVDIEI